MIKSKIKSKRKSKMKRRYYHKPWYIWLVRATMLGLLSVVLWASAIASPFVFVYLLSLRGGLEKVLAFAALAGSVVVMIGFICYLLDRI